MPDLAIEVLSPSDQAELSDRKIGLYRAARTPRLWVIDPRSRTVAVWRQGALDHLEGGDQATGTVAEAGRRGLVRRGDA